MASGERPLYLLLLPPPPRPVTADALRAAYATPLTALLKQLVAERRREPTGSVLDIALPCPALAGSGSPRSASYNAVQQLVAGLYSLLCAIAAKESINVEDIHGIDLRILLLAQPDIEKFDDAAEVSSLVDAVVILPALARCGRPWKEIVTVECEKGEDLVRQFSTAQDGHLKIRHVPGGLVQVDETAETEASSNIAGIGGSGDQHTSVAIGGTFDHIHLGHKLLLTMFAFLLAPAGLESAVRTLTVGLTGDEMLKNKKYPELLESYDDRQKVVVSFMRGIMDFRPEQDANIRTETKNEEGPNGHAVHTWLDERTVVKCVELSDPFGPTITVEDITALVVSGETRSGGKAINDKRKEKGWSEMEVLEVDVLDSGDASESKGGQESFEAKLSSTTIRKVLSEKRQQQKSTKI